MMSGTLFVDGIDAFTTWGVYVTKQGWNDLVAYPPLKEVDENDWQEYDGVDPDLSDPQLDAKDVKINFGIHGMFNHFSAFIDLLSDGAYHWFSSPYLPRPFRLRCVQMPNLSMALRMGTATIKFSDDFSPLAAYKYLGVEYDAFDPTTALSTTIIQADDYLLDGRALSEYNCRVLKGTLAEVLKLPDVKPNLLRNINTQTGAIYDGERVMVPDEEGNPTDKVQSSNVTYKSKDVKVYCYMTANTLAELWQNYYRLLSDLVQPNSRQLYVAAVEDAFECYYSKCSVTTFYPTDKIWLAFTLTLTFIDGTRASDEDIALSDEDGTLLDFGDETFMDVEPH
jgi:hypothetical protein